MNLWHVGIAIYVVFGILGYCSIGGAGARLEGEERPPLWRKLIVVTLWPLAMIGAIEG
jgi:hypothetical protein